MGLKIAGVDMLEGKDGPQLLEVNSSPGLEGIEAATKLDVAGSIIDYISGKVSFPEVDIRQRLTVSRGYDVAELHIPEGSIYVGKTIEGSGLRDNDINILSLYRGNIVIPNPNRSRVIEPGDRLLCFGKVSSMKEMIPEKIRTKRKNATKKFTDKNSR
jgi:ribosomal protein S6--L-glutamate ligase